MQIIVDNIFFFYFVKPICRKRSYYRIYQKDNQERFENSKQFPKADSLLFFACEVIGNKNGYMCIIFKSGKEIDSLYSLYWINEWWIIWIYFLNIFLKIVINEIKEYYNK